MPRCSRCRKKHAADTMFTQDETEVALPNGGPTCLSCYDYLEGRGRYQAQRRRGAETTNAKREKGKEADVETEGGTGDES